MDRMVYTFKKEERIENIGYRGALRHPLNTELRSLHCISS